MGPLRALQGGVKFSLSTLKKYKLHARGSKDEKLTIYLKKLLF
jgi:hypothetical protein